MAFRRLVRFIIMTGYNESEYLGHGKVIYCVEFRLEAQG